MVYFTYSVKHSRVQALAAGRRRKVIIVVTLEALRTARRAFLFYSRRSEAVARVAAPSAAKAKSIEGDRRHDWKSCLPNELTSHFSLTTGPMKALRNLRTIGALLLLVMAIGTAGYHYIEGWPWFDGFYMVVTTLTTIGYQEVHPLSHEGRIFNVFVILAGVSLLLLGVGALSQALLEFELQSFFGRRRMEREIGRLNGHYIICGMGRVGRSVARELARKPVPFVIIDNAEAKRQRFVSENWLVLAGRCNAGTNSA